MRPSIRVVTFARLDLNYLTAKLNFLPVTDIHRPYPIPAADIAGR